MTEADRSAAVVADLSPNLLFTDAMVGVENYCHDLDIAIVNHDYEAVEHIARNAAQAWLGGRSACGEVLRLESKGHCKLRITPYTDAARQHLETTYMNLLERFTRASQVIAVPRMQHALEQMRQLLSAAAKKPLLEADDVQDKRIQGES